MWKLVVLAFQFIGNWEWGRRLVLSLFFTTGGLIFDYISIWPKDREEAKVIIFSESEFALKSCMGDFEHHLNLREALAKHDPNLGTDQPSTVAEQ
jgi:hypothetical protein